VFLHKEDRKQGKNSVRVRRNRRTPITKTTGWHQEEKKRGEQRLVEVEGPKRDLHHRHSTWKPSGTACREDSTHRAPRGGRRKREGHWKLDSKRRTLRELSAVSKLQKRKKAGRSDKQLS